MPNSLIFDHPTVEALAGFIAGQLGETLESPRPGPRRSHPSLRESHRRGRWREGMWCSCARRQWRSQWYVALRTQRSGTTLMRLPWTQADVFQNRAHICRHRENLAEPGQNSAGPGQKRIGQAWAEIGRSCPKLTKVGPTPTQIGNIGPRSANVGRCRPNWGRGWPNGCPRHPKLAQCCPEATELGSVLTGGPRFARFGPESISLPQKHRQHSAQLRPTSVAVDICSMPTSDAEK